MRCQITFFFQIRQAVPGGLAWARFCCWACWARFFLGKKLYYINYSTFTCIPAVFVSRGLGMGGWNSKSLDDTPNWEHLSITLSQNLPIVLGDHTEIIIKYVD